jgi:hypothetical protein
MPFAFCAMAAWLSAAEPPAHNAGFQRQTKSLRLLPQPFRFFQLNLFRMEYFLHAISVTAYRQKARKKVKKCKKYLKSQHVYEQRVTPPHISGVFFLASVTKNATVFTSGRPLGGGCDFLKKVIFG